MQPRERKVVVCTPVEPRININPAKLLRQDIGNGKNDGGVQSAPHANCWCRGFRLRREGSPANSEQGTPGEPPLSRPDVRDSKNNCAKVVGPAIFQGLGEKLFASGLGLALVQRHAYFLIRQVAPETIATQQINVAISHFFFENVYAHKWLGAQRAREAVPVRMLLGFF